MAINQSGNQDSLGSSIVVGEGVAGTPTGGVVSIQGVTTGTPVNQNLSQIGSTSITPYNAQLQTADIINTALSSGSITVSTTAGALRVGASNLTNRKMLLISPITGTIFIGASSAVTVATGIAVLPNNIISFAFGAGVTPFAIASASTTVNVVEGS